VYMFVTVVYAVLFYFCVTELYGNYRATAMQGVFLQSKFCLCQTTRIVKNLTKLVRLL